MCRWFRAEAFPVPHLCFSKPAVVSSVAVFPGTVSDAARRAPEPRLEPRGSEDVAARDKVSSLFSLQFIKHNIQLAMSVIMEMIIPELLLLIKK